MSVSSNTMASDSQSTSASQRNRANERRVNRFAILWAASMIGVAAAIAFLDLPQAANWALALLPILFGLFCQRAYLKLLREVDEMLRQTQLEAMAAGFGTGVIVGAACVVLNLPSEWTAVAILLPMWLAYIIRVFRAGRELAKDADK